MASTFTSLHCHAVFSTKDRFPSIDASWRPRLHAFLGGALRTLNALPLEIGGTNDHVHLLFGMTSSHRLKDILREIKSSSSAWVHQELKLDPFAWQGGYAAFSVSPTARTAVRRYIANQEAHHRAKTFRDEIAALLKQAGIKFDPKFLD